MKLKMKFNETKIEKTNFSEWVQDLNKKKCVSSAIEFFIRTAKSPILYFEHHLEKDWLSLKYNSPSSQKHDPICIRLHESDKSYEPKKLYDPRQIPVFHSCVKSLLNNDTYFSIPLIFNHQVIGVFASTHHHELLQEQILILNHYIKNFLWEEKWTKENALDELTSSLNKKSFLKQLFIEISRARRLSLPVSLILWKVDQWDTLKSTYGSYRPTLLIKSMINRSIKDSRTYDIFGTWPEGQVGIILPHTSEKAASLKSEKLRWSVQSADFSKVFSSHGHLTLSLALAEYPRVGRSAENLFQVTSKALHFAHKKYGGNITTVATPNPGFKPDFIFQNSVNPLRDLT